MSLRMTYHIAFYTLWLLGPVMQVALAALIARRGMRKEFPLFFSYTLFQVASFVLKFVAYHYSQLEYFYIYWATSALSIVFGCAVIYEIFQQVFRPYDALRHMGRVLFRWAMLVLVLIAVIMAISSPHPEGNRILQLVFTLERSLRVTQCGLVLFLFLFAPFLGVSSRHHMFGIALGFGLYGSLDLLLVTLVAVGIPAGATLSMIKSGAYSLVVLLWIWYVLSPEPSRRPARIAVAERWNLALAGAQQRPGGASFSSLEATVDRVLTKANGKSTENGKAH